MSTQVQNIANPFGAPVATSGNTAMATADEAKQIAEIQGRMVIAKKFPRDVKRCADRIIQSCTRPALAEAALYSYARGGTDITGPSIRLAEAIAQQWENFEFGFREIGRGVGSDGVTYSDVEAYAWDLETNTRRPVSFRVRHWRDTKKGGYALKDERDIYELTANMAQRRVRACILGVIPGDMVEAAQRQCEVTLQANADTSQDAVKNMLEKFTAIGVTKAQIEARIQRHVDTIRPAQILDLRKVYNSIKDGMSDVGDWFDRGDDNASKASERPTLPPYPSDQFSKDIAQWKAMVESGRQTPDGLISMVGSRYALTEEQKTKIRQLDKPADAPPPSAPDDDWGAAYDEASQENIK